MTPKALRGKKSCDGNALGKTEGSMIKLGVSTRTQITQALWSIGAFNSRDTVNVH